MENKENSTFRLLPCPSDKCIYISSPDEIPASIPESIYLTADLKQRDAEPLLLTLEQTLGPKLLVPDLWRNILRRAGLLVPSSLSGGTLISRLEEANYAAPGRCWLLTEPIGMRFPLPCPSGRGIQLPEDILSVLIEKKQIFYSSELCCRYCYDLPNGMILFDTEETMEQKILLAETCGFIGAVVTASINGFQNKNFL